MKVNNLSYINFAYNKAYHKKIQTALSHEPDALAKALKEQDESCTSIEDKLIEMEKSWKASTQDYKDLGEFMILQKGNIASHMFLNYNDFDYPDELMKTYISELENFKREYSDNPAKYLFYSEGWRGQLALILSEYTNDDYLPKLKALNVKGVDKKSDTKKTVDEIRQQALDEAEDKKAGDILTLYEPSDSSPSGFADVVGLDDIKDLFFENVIEYIDNPELLEADKREFGIRPPRGFLFYGPPGCGKTFVVQALAQETGLKMYKMSVSKVGSSYVNATSKNIEKAFDTLKKTVKKEGKPVILFLDEMDSLAFKRNNGQSGSAENSKTTSTLLTNIESARDYGIIVIAATNEIEIIDEALDQRFNVQKYFPLPDDKQIKALLSSYLSKITRGSELLKDETALANLSSALIGYSNRQIVDILDRAMRIARKQIRSGSESYITKQHIQDAIKNCNFAKIDEQKYKRKSDQRKTLIGFN